MVGVPGRSKGCKTCRNRRVRCDEAKPECQRCIKAGFECLGYERPTLWRNTYTNCPSVTGRHPGTEISKPPSRKKSSSPGYHSASSSSSCLSSPPRQISLIAFQWDIYVARMFDNFIWRSYGAGWLDQAAKGSLGNLSLDAVKALSQISFGQSNRTRDIQTRGDAQYGKCIRVLLVELQSGTSLPNEGFLLICPILILTMVACIQMDRDAAFSHLGAVSRVLKVYGPAQFQQQSLRNALEAARATLLVASLSAKRRLFLEEQRWRTVPWSPDPASKRPQSYLLDIFVTIPGLLEEELRLDEGDPCLPAADDPLSPGLISDRQLYRRFALCNNIAIQLEELYRWRWRWQRENGQHVAVSQSSWEPEDPAWNVLGGKPERLNRLVFNGSTYANDIMLYNAALIWLVALLWKTLPSYTVSIIENCARRAAPSNYNGNTSPALKNSSSSSFSSSSPYSSSSSSSSSSEASDADPNIWCPSPANPTPSTTNPFEPLDPPGASASIRDPAIEICRAYDWQAEHHGRGCCDQICLYLLPVGIARGVLEAGAGAEDPHAREWIRDMLASSPVTSDYFGAGSNVAGFRSYVTRRALYPTDGVGVGGAGDGDGDRSVGGGGMVDDDGDDDDDNGDREYSCSGSGKGVSLCTTTTPTTTPPCHLLSQTAASVKASYPLPLPLPLSR